MPLTKEELIRKTTLKRNFNKYNKQLISDYEDMIDEGVNGTVGQNDVNDFVKQYVQLATPLITSSFLDTYKATNGYVPAMVSINKLMKQIVNIYKVKMKENISNSVNRLNELNIDKVMYNKLRTDGATITEALSVSDKNMLGNYAPCSEKLLEQSLKNQQRSIENRADYHYNSNLLDGNGDKVYTHKTWVWSGAENTRHSGMDNVTIPIDEPFVVVNEVSGDIDYLMYPCDDNGSPSNTYNCLCDIVYSNEFYGI